MKILAKVYDVWHSVSHIHGSDTKATYCQNTLVTTLKTTKYWEMFRRQTFHCSDNSWEHTALALIGDYCYPITIITESARPLSEDQFKDSGELFHHIVPKLLIKKYEDRWPARIFGNRHVLEDKMPNPIPEVKFGILILDRASNLLLTDPIITKLPKPNGFYELFSPEFIWQEISMSLAKEADIPVDVSDIDKLQQAGFDVKTSFRGK